MRRIMKIWMLVALGAMFLTSCKKDDPDPDNDIPKEILILNHWIWDGMTDLYLWEAFMPYLSPDKQPDPEVYFYRLLYDDDRDSWITDNYDELMAMFEGVQLSTGVTAIPGLVSQNDVVYIVEYVTPGSPAADSGITRGDLIYAVDGQSLNKDNYSSLYYQTTATLEFGNWDGSRIVPDGRKITVTAVDLNRNPVVHHEVIDFEGYKIGYFVYTQFTGGQDGEWFLELNSVFEEFKAQGVTEVVVDLRYNPGGSLGLSAYLAGTLAPASVMQNNEVFVNLVWNDGMNEYWKAVDLDGDGQPDGANSSQLLIRLPQSDMNMDLSRVWFLTTGSSASASESLMAGLYPYTEVIQIGTTTYGKCYGSVTIDDWEQPKRHNWAMQPIVLKYSNAQGFTDFLDGIYPDYYVEEDLLDLEPFGSFGDPLLATALEEITGVAPSVKKAAVPFPRVQLLPLPRQPLPELRITLPGSGTDHILF